MTSKVATNSDSPSTYMISENSCETLNMRNENDFIGII